MYQPGKRVLGRPFDNHAESTDGAVEVCFQEGLPSGVEFLLKDGVVVDAKLSLRGQDHRLRGCPNPEDTERDDDGDGSGDRGD
jgi:hypothetical protein